MLTYAEAARSGGLPLLKPSPPPLTVKVLTFNRPAALERLLKSLEAAEYMGDTVVKQ